MSSDHIRRQHEATTIPELYGARCSEFRAVFREQDQRYGPLYLRLSDAWHRFYLDAGLLFWEGGPAPDPDDDLLDGERYCDLATWLAVTGVAISKIEMADSCLTLEFENRARLVLRIGVEDDGAELVETVVGQAAALSGGGPADPSASGSVPR